MRQLLDEADRVGHEDARPGLRLERAHRGVERREQLVGDEHLAAGERAHERRLAGVGVADERDAAAGPAARGGGGPASRWIAASSSRQLGDAVADLAAVELERRLAGALPRACRSDRPGRLAQARREVLEPRDLDLQARLAAPRVAVEDLDDDAGAVEHLRAGRPLEVARLARARARGRPPPPWAAPRGDRGAAPVASASVAPRRPRRRPWRRSGPPRRRPWPPPWPVLGAGPSAAAAAAASQRSFAFEVRSAAPEAMTPGPPVRLASSFSLPVPSTVPAPVVARRWLSVATVW